MKLPINHLRDVIAKAQPGHPLTHGELDAIRTLLVRLDELEFEVSRLHATAHSDSVRSRVIVPPKEPTGPR